MEGAVPYRLHTLAHPLEAFLLGFTRSTTCGVLQINGFCISNVLTRTSHDPLIIRSVITFWNPRAILARKPVGPFNLNRGQYLLTQNHGISSLDVHGRTVYKPQ